MLINHPRHNGILIIVFLLIAVVVAGQEPLLRQLEVKDGLPSATIYHAIQDHEGYLWLSSEAGLTKFNGVSFKNFTMDDSLPDNEIFGIFEDSKHRIWTKCYNGKFAYLRNDSIFHAYNTPFLDALQHNYWVINITEDRKQNLYFALQRDGFSVLGADNQVKIYRRGQLAIKLIEWANQQEKIKPNININNRLSILGFYELDDGIIRVIANIGEFEYNPADKSCEAVKLYNKEINQITVLNHNRLLANDNKKNVLAYDPQSGFTALFNNTDVGVEFEVVPYFMDDNGELWLGSLGDGIYVLNQVNTPTVISHFLNKKSVSWAFKDNENNIWLTTLGDGVYMLPSNTVLTYNANSGLTSQDLYAITGDDNGNIYVGTKDGKINIIKPNNTIEVLETKQDERGYNRINGIVIGDDGAIWSGSDLGLKVFGKNVNYDTKNVKVLTKDDTGNIYIGSSENMVKISPNLTTQTIWTSRTMAIYPEHDDFIWLGSNDGLHLYSGGEVVDINSENNFYQYRITDIDMTQDSVLCLCTSGIGVVLKYLNELTRVSTQDKLVSNSCKDIFVDENNYVWVATSTGISRFKVDRNTLTINNLVSYTEADNLASSDVRGVYVKNGKVWASTSSGLSYFEEVLQKNKFLPPPIYITGVQIFDEDTVLNKTYVLPYHKNNIKIEFSGVSFKSGSRIQYQYRLTGVDKHWVTSKITTASYPTLDPGTYTFEVKAINIDQTESDIPASIKIIILKPWWKTTWFIMLSSVLGISLISTIVYFILRNSRQKSQMRRQIVESEQMALRAQMNPHFIFNALNSIQHFITMEDEMSANYYLTRFSKLVRKVLENSKTSFIPLTEEIETLRLYLELETLRFEGKFEYIIEVDDNVSTYDVEIPSMILQPFAENAIWHGLMPKRDNPRLEIRFKQDELYLTCEIEDNGIGRKAAAENNKNRTKEHKSTGISNTTQRLSLLAHVKDANKLVKITDLEENGEALGTLVTLKIPLVHEEF